MHYTIVLDFFNEKKKPFKASNLDHYKLILTLITG